MNGTLRGVVDRTGKDRIKFVEVMDAKNNQ